MTVDLERPNVSTAGYGQKDGSLNHYAIRMVCKRDGTPDYRKRARICRAHAVDCGADMSPAGSIATLWSAYWFHRWLGNEERAKDILGMIVKEASECEPPRLADLEAVKFLKEE